MLKFDRKEIFAKYTKETGCNYNSMEFSLIMADINMAVLEYNQIAKRVSVESTTRRLGKSIRHFPVERWADVIRKYTHFLKQQHTIFDDIMYNLPVLVIIVFILVPFIAYMISMAFPGGPIAGWRELVKVTFPAGVGVAVLYWKLNRC